MHELAKKIADCIKTKVEAKGIDNIEGHDLEELGEWVDIIKDIACYDKDMRIIEAMDNAEDSEESMRYIEMYEDYPERKGYRGQRRDSRGLYMRRRGRMGYNEPMMYDERREADYIDGKMYYDDGVTRTTDISESRYDRARRGYEEAKNMNDTSADGKRKSMENLESYMKELSEDMTQFVGKMDANEKAMVKSKLQNLMTKF